ncbi:MAG: hypothetical protein KDA84_07885, partial [Planctomycetaceae bacterium]|nr:hypothetical protein [Planctomycetaceae bacterium]
MLFVDWLNRTVRERFAKTPARRSRHFRLGAVEALEDRCLLATFTVMNTNDAGPNSLRQAISDANNTSGQDTILFDPTLTGRTIPVGAQLVITEAVTINGSSSRADGIILDGGAAQGIFQVNSSANGVVINNLTMTNGSDTEGGGFRNFGVATLNNVVVSNSSATAGGGGIANRGSGNLTINNSQIVGNQSQFAGGIFNDNSAGLTINRSTISGNFGNGGASGGVLNRATTTINASTISGNTSSFQGAGVLHESGTLTINNTTIAHNSDIGTASLGGGGLQVQNGTVNLTHVTIANNLSLSTAANSGGGIGRTGGTVNLERSIVAQNLNPANTANNNTGGTINQTFSTVTNNRVVGPLQDNGGPTLTMLPTTRFLTPLDSLGLTPFSTDQRGYPRSVDGNVNGILAIDQGAVEFNPGVNNPYAVSTGPGVVATVFVFGEDGRLQREIHPDGQFTGEIRVALGDVNGDGIKDVITAPGPGGASTIKAFHGFTGAEIRSFNAYGLFTGGVFLASGDFNGDGRDDIVTAPGAGGSADVRVIDSADTSGATDLRRFQAYDNFFGGVQVAVATLSGNNPDIVTAPGPGGGPNVRVFGGTNGIQFGNFNAYGEFSGGVFVVTGDV